MPAFSDEERRHQLKSYWKKMKGQPGFVGCDFDFSDSEDEERKKESAVPSMADLLGDLEEQERHEWRNKPEQRIADAAVPSFDSLLEQLDSQDAAEGVQRKEEPDAVKEFLGTAVDPQEALSAHCSLYRPKRGGFSDYQQMLTNSDSAKRPGNLASKMPQRVEVPADVSKQAPASLPKGWVRCGPGKAVSLISLVAEGAVNQACNSVFKFETNHRGRPLYKAPTGAIIYFSTFWKMNSSYKVTSWLYSNSLSCQMPPEGIWAAEDKPSSRRVTVCIQGRRLAVIGEKGPQLMLEDGTKVAKSEENKSWCWVAMGDSTEAYEQDYEHENIPPLADLLANMDDDNFADADEDPLSIRSVSIPSDKTQAKPRMSFSQRAKYIAEVKELKRQLSAYGEAFEDNM